MLEDKSTRRTKKPAAAAKKAEPKVVIETAAYRSRSADTVWLRRCAWLSQPTPFSST